MGQVRAKKGQVKAKKRVKPELDKEHRRADIALLESFFYGRLYYLARYTRRIVLEPLRRLPLSRCRNLSGSIFSQIAKSKRFTFSSSFSFSHSLPLFDKQ